MSTWYSSRSVPKVHRNYHRVCAGACVFNSNGKVLLVKDNWSKWGFPKGYLEANESSLEGAQREVREETGITFTVIKKLLPVHYEEPRTTRKGTWLKHVLIFYGTGDGVPRVDKNEIISTGWFAVDQAKSMLSGSPNILSVLIAGMQNI